MLTIKQCREKLKNNGVEFTDEQVLAIRNFLYKLAKINIDYIKDKIKENEQKSNPIHPCLNR
jgi:uncharacterized protein YpuA (DUF1002 family)